MQLTERLRKTVSLLRRRGSGAHAGWVEEAIRELENPPRPGPSYPPEKEVVTTSQLPPIGAPYPGQSVDDEEGMGAESMETDDET